MSQVKINWQLELYGDLYELAYKLIYWGGGNKTQIHVSFLQKLIHLNLLAHLYQTMNMFQAIQNTRSHLFFFALIVIAWEVAYIFI